MRRSWSVRIGLSMTVWLRRAVMRGSSAGSVEQPPSVNRRPRIASAKWRGWRDIAALDEKVQTGRNHTPRAGGETLRIEANHSSSAVRGVRRLPLGPGPLGFSVEDRARLGGREGPIAARNLGLELTGRPARVANEDAQTFHRLVAAEQLAQQ